MKTTLNISVLSLSIIFIVFFYSCSKTHDDIYGKQSVTITNDFNYSMTIWISSINGSETMELGTVNERSTKTFELNWRNDCHYDFEARGGGNIFNKSNLDVCSGGEWDIN